MTHSIRRLARLNPFHVSSRVFEAQRFGVDDGYGDGYNLFDGYSVTIVEDDDERNMIVPAERLPFLDRLVVKMERDSQFAHLLSEDERQYFNDKYAYLRSLRDALKGV